MALKRLKRTQPALAVFKIGRAFWSLPILDRLGTAPLPAWDLSVSSSPACWQAPARWWWYPTGYCPVTTWVVEDTQRDWDTNCCLAISRTSPEPGEGYVSHALPAKRGHQACHQCSRDLLAGSRSLARSVSSLGAKDAGRPSAPHGHLRLCVALVGSATRNSSAVISLRRAKQLKEIAKIFYGSLSQSGTSFDTPCLGPRELPTGIYVSSNSDNGRSKLHVRSASDRPQRRRHR